MNEKLRNITHCELESSSHSLQANADLLPASMSTVVLKHNLTNASPYCLWLLSISKVGLEYCSDGCTLA